MNKVLEQNKAKQIGAVILSWLLTALLLLLAAAFLSGKMKLRQEHIGLLSAAIVFLASTVAGWVLLRGGKERGRLITALIFWAVTAAVLLMLGFLIYGERMTLPGLLRIVVSSLCGAMLALLPGGKRPQHGGKGRFTISK